MPRIGASFRLTDSVATEGGRDIMGLTRKAMSLFSAGAVDWRSDKERAAAYTRGTRRQARKQTKILKQIAKGK